MGNDSDNELIQRIQAGDRQAMTALLERHQKMVFNTAYRMLGNADDAADVTQTALMKALGNIAKFDPEHRFFSWLYRITLNETLDQLSRRKRVGQLDADLTSPGAAPDAQTESGIISKEVQTVLMKLPEEQRSVLVLRYFSDCSYQQISAILRIPEQTVKSRLYSARQQMQKHLVAAGILST